jgi:hypothetical protein
MTNLKWIRFSEKQPPMNTDVLVLVNGRIYEGFLHNYVLMGHTEPTIFKTLYMTQYECAQNTSWGDDPYWAEIPEKPKQISNKPIKVEKLTDAL